MKKLIALAVMALAFSFVLAGFTIAQEGQLETDVNDGTNGDLVILANEGTTEEYPELEGDPGITPDSPVLYGLERAWERISLAFTFNKAAKAQKGLEHARERLLEVKAMIEGGKIQAAEKARAIYEKRMEKAKKDLEGIEVDSQEEKIVGSMRNLVNVQKKIEKQEMAIEALKNVLAEKEFTDEEREKLEAVLERMGNKTQAMKEKAEEKRNRVRERLRAVTEKNESEVEEIEEEIEDQETLSEARKMIAQRWINRTEQSFTRLKERLEISNLSTVNQEELQAHLSNIESKLAQAKEAYEAESYEEAMETIKPVNNFGRQLSVAVKTRNQERISSLQNLKEETRQKVSAVKEEFIQRREEIKSATTRKGNNKTE